MHRHIRIQIRMDTQQKQQDSHHWKPIFLPNQTLSKGKYQLKYTVHEVKNEYRIHIQSGTSTSIEHPILPRRIPDEGGKDFKGLQEICRRKAGPKLSLGGVGEKTSCGSTLTNTIRPGFIFVEPEKRSIIQLNLHTTVNSSV